jgi:hypothetical protein
MLLQLNPTELEAVSSYWYLKFADHWGGPFSYIEVLQMLKSRRINRSMKIRAGKLSNENSGEWHQLADLQEFSPTFISEFSKYYVPKGRPFDLVRKFVRMEYKAKVLVVSEKGNVQECLCTELSAGGAKIKVPADFLEEGETATVQFFYNGKIKLKSFKSKANVLRLSEISFNKEGENGDVSEVFSIEFVDLKARYKRMLLDSTQMKIYNLAKYLRSKQKEVVDVLDLSEFSEKYPHLMLSP